MTPKETSLQTPSAGFRDGNSADPADWPLVSIVVPAHNERDVLDEFFRRIKAVMAALPVRHEIVFVNDGSTDDTLARMQAFRASDSNVAVIDLSRNFGKEIALTAGLDHANGDAVIVIDADLQDPPEVIPDLIAGWREGYHVVSAQRMDRAGEGWFKRATAHAFYRLMQPFGPVRLPVDTGDFRLISRQAVSDLGRLRERHRFMKGLFAWIGYRQKSVPYRRAPRGAGRSKWNYLKLVDLSIEGFTSFTVAPLRIAMYLGLLTALMAFLYGAVIVFKTLVYGEAVRGYPTIMVTLLFLGGVQLISLGVIGEYLGRVFNETKQRPLYLVQDLDPSVHAATGEDATAQAAGDARHHQRVLHERATEIAPPTKSSSTKRPPPKHPTRRKKAG